MAKFYYVHLKLNPSSTMEEAEGKMSKALDWFRIDASSWILYSTSSSDKLYQRLSPLAKDGGNVFVCELNLSNRQGWMAKSFWAWLKKDRDL